MCHDMRFVVLIWERLERHALHGVRVLRRRVNRLRRLRRRQDSVDVLHIQCIVHAPVGFVLIVKLRSLRCQLHLCLCQRQALRHRKDRRIRHRQDVHAAIEVLLHDLRRDVLPDEVWIWHRVVGEHFGEEAELLLLTVVKTLVDRGDDLRSLLDQCNCGSDGSLCVSVRDLCVGDLGKSSS